jgi:dCMP deaminase
MSDDEMSKEIEKARKYIQLAYYNAQLFSKDPHTKVGAYALTADFSRVLATGINGQVRGIDDDDENRWVKPQKYSYVQHAESNVVANAARTGTPLDNAVIAVTKFPCSTCTKLLVQAGIKKIYTIEPDYSTPPWGEDAKISEQILMEAGVPVVKYVSAICTTCKCN